MILLRNKIYSSIKDKGNDPLIDKTTAGYIAGAGGLLGAGGYLAGTSTKKFENKALNKLNKKIKDKLSELPEQELQEGRNNVRWKADRLKKEQEILDRRMRILEKQGGLKGKFKKEITKRNAERRRQRIEDIYNQNFKDIAKKYSLKKKELEQIQTEGAKKIKTKMKLKGATGSLLALGGVGLGAAAGYRYYKNRAKRYDSKS